MRTYEFIQLGLEGIQKYGWIAGDLGNSRTGMCALGGLSYAERVVVRKGLASTKQARKLHRKAAAELKTTLLTKEGGEHHAFTDPYALIVKFNDKGFSDHLTEENEVLGVFKDTITRLRKKAHR